MKLEKLSKDLVGKTLIASPWGNEARYDRKLREFTVLRVGRKYMVLSARGGERKYTADGKSEEAIRGGLGGNGGFNFYLSMDDYNRDVEISRKKREISEFFRYSFSLENNDINKIHEIISAYNSAH